MDQKVHLSKGKQTKTVSNIGAQKPKKRLVTTMCQLVCLICVIDLLFIGYQFSFLFLFLLFVFCFLFYVFFVFFCFFCLFFSRTADLDGVSIVNQFVVGSLILSSLLLFSPIVLVETQIYILKCGTLDKKG